MNESYIFLDNTYTQESLKEMSVEDLLSLRNLIATNLGVGTVKSFKDHDAAVAGTWKALVRFSNTDENADPKAKKPKVKKEPKERKMAKAAEVQYIKRPTRKMFAKMVMAKPFDGDEDRSHRSENYTDGQLVIDASTTEGCLPWDIYNWEKQGYVKVVDPTDDEYTERRAAWFAKEGREDPELNKDTKEKESETE